MSKKEREIVIPDTLKWTPEQVALIKRTVAIGATDDELALFIYQAKRTGLDPLARQIHFVRRFDSTQEKMVGAIQTGIDGFRLIAARTGKYRPDIEPPRFTYDETRNLLSAKVRVFFYHEPTGQWNEVEAEAFWDEYVQKKKDKSINAMWKRMPRLMLSKCAEALAIRKAFPAELSGMYTPEETEFGEHDRPETVKQPQEKICDASTPDDFNRLSGGGVRKEE